MVFKFVTLHCNISNNITNNTCVDIYDLYSDNSYKNYNSTVYDVVTCGGNFLSYTSAVIISLLFIVFLIIVNL